MTKLTPIKKLRDWRERSGKTQEWCAEQVGTTRHVWSDWERGRRIPNRTFMPRVVALTGSQVIADDFYPQMDAAA